MLEYDQEIVWDLPTYRIMYKGSQMPQNDIWIHTDASFEALLFSSSVVAEGYPTVQPYWILELCSALTSPHFTSNILRCMDPTGSTNLTGWNIWRTICPS